MANLFRTDMAVELNRLSNPDSNLPGVRVDEQERGGIRLTTINIDSPEAAEALCKPIDEYITLEVGAFLRREENSFETAAELFAEKLRGLPALGGGGGVLVVGLGNRAITPDAVGPEVIDGVLVTRHLRERSPEHFGDFRDVAAFCSGVLGTTGIESADVIKALCGLTRPDCVIAVDALAAMKISRLCRTVQISDSGIVPGSGIGNSRAALNRDTLGVPVIAVGVPTVVDAATLVRNFVSEATGLEGVEEAGMIVTPKDIDANVHDISRLIAYGVNLALHEGLTMAEIDMLIG